MRLLLLLVVILALTPQMVSADELWIQNQGGLEVVIEYDGDVSLGEVGGIAAINPDYGDGTAKVATTTLETEWVVVTADNITGYTIEVACNQRLEDVAPEVLMVIDYEGTRISYDPTETTREAVIVALDLVGPPPPPPDATNMDVWVDPFKAQVDGSDGQSIRDMDNKVFLESVVIGPENVWYWT